MKLAAVYFDDTVCIPGGKDTGGGVRHDLRDSAFHASDGWRIAVTLTNGARLFAIERDGMPGPAYVGGYGFTFTPLDDQPYEETSSGSLNGEAADGQAPGTSADAGAKPAPTAKKPREPRAKKEPKP